LNAIAMKAPWQKLWENWLVRRTPRAQRITFTQRTVYILPSKGGWMYALVVLVLLLAAINEQLNLAYALAFLLGGVGLSSMSLTHSNLRGLSLVLGPTPSVHAGQTMHVQVILDATDLKKGRFGLVLNHHLRCEVMAGQQAASHLPVVTQQRGWLNLPRWPIETTYPLGLFRAWGYWRAAPAVLVWPALEVNAPALPNTAGNIAQDIQSGTPDQQAHQDEMREWQHGDSLRTVIWKKSATRMACGLTPVVRQASAMSSRSVWIDWHLTDGLPLEARLSRMATWLVSAEAQRQQHPSEHASVYGLRLPGRTIACGQGPAHLAHCLNTLSVWPASDAPAETPT
jgi:uncharacterized protein (DUF58 family)